MAPFGADPMIIPKFPSKKLTLPPCPKLLLLTVPAPRPSERCASSPPGPPRHGTRTALISLGIRKLVRFHKSALALRNSGIIIPLGHRRRAPSGMPRRRADGPFAPRQREWV